MTFFQRLKKKFNLEFINFIPKRVRIFVSTLCMTGLILLSTFFEFTAWWWLWIIIFAIFSYILTFISIYEGIDGVERFMLFIMPVLFTIFVYFIYSLFPVRWLTRLPLILFYGFGFYALVLASNIFNVGVEKSLQLYRAAFSVNFLFQTLLIFLAMQVLFSLKLNFLVNSLLAGVVTFPLITQLVWTVNPQDKYDRSVLKYSYIVTLIIMEIILTISFIPLKTSIQALVVTACYYSASGIIYHYIDNKLFKQIIREYLFVIFFVFVIAFLTLQW